MKMNSLKRLLWCVAMLVAFASCRSQFDTLLSSNDVDAKYKAAFEYFETEKYSKAASLFESMSVLTEGTNQDDTVQYYWGLSNYNNKDYVTAESNFRQFVSTYPRSPFTEDARYLRLDCLYKSTYRYELDQNPTRLAINAIIEYLKDYGDDCQHYKECHTMLDDLYGRLDRKAYEAARLYYNMEDYKASRVAFKNILKDNADNAYREDILYYIAMSSFKFAQMSVSEKQKDRYMTFMDDYLNFVGEIPQSKYSRELRALYSRAQRAIGKFSGADEELSIKEKEFEKERKIEEKLLKTQESAVQEAVSAEEQPGGKVKKSGEKGKK